jgi:hypothetical protein
MSDKDTGGPAFPVLHSIDGNWVKEPLDKYAGMTLRDYFAAAALQGLISEPNIKAPIEEFASRSYQLADAMLKARQS